MAYEPTLSEISNYSERAQSKGEVNTPIDISSGLKGVWEAAKTKNENDWRKYEQHNKNITEYMKNAQFDYEGILPEDRDNLIKASGEYFKELYNNPSVIANPTKNPAAYAKLTELQGKIQSGIAKSKQDAKYASFQEKFRQENPELYNEINNKKVKEWKDNPNRRADDLLWDMPHNVDMDAFAKAIHGTLAGTTAEKPVAAPVGYIATVPVTSYSQDEFFKKALLAYRSAEKSGDKYGSTIAQAAKDLYQKLPQEEKEKYIERSKQSDKEPYGKVSPEEWFFIHSAQEHAPAFSKEGAPKQVKDLAFEEQNKLNLEGMKEAGKERHERVMEDIGWARVNSMKSLNNAKINKLKETASDNPEQTFNEIFKNKMDTYVTKQGNVVSRVNAKNMSKSFLESIGIDPINQDGDYNIVPANIKIGGKAIDENTVDSYYKEWLKSDDAKNMLKDKGHNPTVFDFINKAKGSYEPEVVGRSKPKINKNSGKVIEQGGKIIRSNRISSLINQMGQSGVKGKEFVKIMSELTNNDTEFDDSGE